MDFLAQLQVEPLVSNLLKTGGSSGIGLATAHLLSSRGAGVHILDRDAPPAGTVQDSPNSSEHGTRAYHPCELTSWSSLLDTFTTIGHVDIVVANAGVSQETDYFADTFTAAGTLAEPTYSVIDVNLKATLNVVKLALRAFRRQWAGQTAVEGGGSLVLTSSATAYSPELSLPVYSASKLAVRGKRHPALPYFIFQSTGTEVAAFTSAFLLTNYTTYVSE